MSSISNLNEVDDDLTFSTGSQCTIDAESIDDLYRSLQSSPPIALSQLSDQHIRNCNESILYSSKQHIDGSYIGTIADNMETSLLDQPVCPPSKTLPGQAGVNTNGSSRPLSLYISLPRCAVYAKRSTPMSHSNDTLPILACSTTSPISRPQIDHNGATTSTISDNNGNNTLKLSSIGRSPFGSSSSSSIAIPLTPLASVSTPMSSRSLSSSAHRSSPRPLPSRPAPLPVSPPTSSSSSQQHTTNGSPFASSSGGPHTQRSIPPRTPLNNMSILIRSASSRASSARPPSARPSSSISPPTRLSQLSSSSSSSQLHKSQPSSLRHHPSSPTVPTAQPTQLLHISLSDDQSISPLATTPLSPTFSDDDGLQQQPYHTHALIYGSLLTSSSEISSSESASPRLPPLPLPTVTPTFSACSPTLSGLSARSPTNLSDLKLPQGHNHSSHTGGSVWIASQPYKHPRFPQRPSLDRLISSVQSPAIPGPSSLSSSSLSSSSSSLSTGPNCTAVVPLPPQKKTPPSSPLQPSVPYGVSPALCLRPCIPLALPHRKNKGTYDQDDEKYNVSRHGTPKDSAQHSPILAHSSLPAVVVDISTSSPVIDHSLATVADVIVAALADNDEKIHPLSASSVLTTSPLVLSQPRDDVVDLPSLPSPTIIPTSRTISPISSPSATPLQVSSIVDYLMYDYDEGENRDDNDDTTTHHHQQQLERERMHHHDNQDDPVLSSSLLVPPSTIHDSNNNTNNNVDDVDSLLLPSYKSSLNPSRSAPNISSLVSSRHRYDEVNGLSIIEIYAHGIDSDIDDDYVDCHDDDNNNTPNGNSNTNDYSRLEDLLSLFEAAAEAQGINIDDGDDTPLDSDGDDDDDSVMFEIDADDLAFLLTMSTPPLPIPLGHDYNDTQSIDTVSISSTALTDSSISDNDCKHATTNKTTNELSLFATQCYITDDDDDDVDDDTVLAIKTIPPTDITHNANRKRKRVSSSHASGNGHDDDTTISNIHPSKSPLSHDITTDELLAWVTAPVQNKKKKKLNDNDTTPTTTTNDTNTTTITSATSINTTNDTTLSYNDSIKQQSISKLHPSTILLTEPPVVHVLTSQHQDSLLYDIADTFDLLDIWEATHDDGHYYYYYYDEDEDGYDHGIPQFIFIPMIDSDDNDDDDDNNTSNVDVDDDNHIQQTDHDNNTPNSLSSITITVDDDTATLSHNNDINENNNNNRDDHSNSIISSDPSPSSSSPSSSPSSRTPSVCLSFNPHVVPSTQSSICYDDEDDDDDTATNTNKAPITPITDHTKIIKRSTHKSKQNNHTPHHKKQTTSSIKPNKININNTTTITTTTNNNNNK